MFSLGASFLPVFLWLAISSSFRFGQEKAAGVLELLSYGPADGTLYLMASFLKDIAVAAASLLLIAAFLWLTAALGNLVLGPLFLFSLPVIFFLALAVLAYGSLFSAISSSASSALASFLGIMVLYILVLVGSLSIASESVHSVAAAAATIVQWFSPFFYASLCMKAVQGGSVAGFLAGIGLLLGLALALLVAGHIAISIRGVRA